jgi:hypothetical protein
VFGNCCQRFWRSFPWLKIRQKYPVMKCHLTFLFGVKHFWIWEMWQCHTFSDSTQIWTLSARDMTSVFPLQHRGKVFVFQARWLVFNLNMHTYMFFLLLTWDEGLTSWRLTYLIYSAEFISEWLQCKDRESTLFVLMLIYYRPLDGLTQTNYYRVLD